MTRRFRTCAALFALLAFSASFAEQAWAGTCAPEAAETAEHHGAAGAQVHAGDGTMERPSAPAPHRTPDTPDECPLQAAAAGCALLLAPARASDAVPPADAPRLLIPPRAAPSRALLLASPFFRPPQR